MVGHLKPVVIGLALAEVLDLVVNEQDPHLTCCPKDRIHLSFPYNLLRHQTGRRRLFLGQGAHGRPGRPSTACQTAPSSADTRWAKDTVEFDGRDVEDRAAHRRRAFRRPGRPNWSALMPSRNLNRRVAGRVVVTNQFE